MRIVILSDRIPPEHIGGAGKVAWELARGLARCGHDLHVIAATAGPSFRDRHDGLPTYHIHSRYPARFQGWLSLWNPQTVRSLRDLFAEIQPDVINAHNIHQDLSYASLSVAHRLHIPAVFTSHDAMPFAYGKLRHFIDPTRCGVDSAEQYRLPFLFNARQMRLRYNPLRNITIRHILRRNIQVRTCVSDAQRQALEANNLPPFRVVYNGLDLAHFAVSSEVIEGLRRRLDLANRQVILFGGRVTPDKGSRQLLAALDRIRIRIPAVLLLVLTAGTLDGSGFDVPEFRPVREQHVRLGGWLSGDELAAAYHLADVVTLPSIYLEPAGMMSLEGMAASKPVVATCYGGPPEIVVDGETGYIVNPFDTDAFAERLERLLLDPVLRQRMGAAGRQRLEERFTLGTQVNDMLAAYHDAMAGL